MTEQGTAGAMRPPPAAVRFSVLIPARMASSRLANKPLADIAGLPMVVRVAQRAAQSGALRTVVAADDARILQACAQHGIEAIATRGCASAAAPFHQSLPRRSRAQGMGARLK